MHFTKAMLAAAFMFAATAPAPPAHAEALDTIMAAARQTTRIAFVADNPGKWLIDCRILAKEAAAMAAWFEVT